MCLAVFADHMTFASNGVSLPPMTTSEESLRLRLVDLKATYVFFSLTTFTHIRLFLL